MTGPLLMDWLLDSDPALRWQVERDLLDAPEEVPRGSMFSAAPESSGRTHNPSGLRYYPLAVETKVHNGRLRLAFETHQQIHDVPRPRPAIEEITDDDQSGSAAGPCEIGIQDPDVLQRRDHCVIGAVHVGKRDNASSVIDAPVVCVGAGTGEEDQAEQ